jgi:hypothetical protein
MTRAARERRRTVRRWRAFRTVQAAFVPPPGERGSLPPGRFRKTLRLGGCGRARCPLCHGEKLDGRPTFREEVARRGYREALREADLAHLDRRQRLRA